MGGKNVYFQKRGQDFGPSKSGVANCLSLARTLHFLGLRISNAKPTKSQANAGWVIHTQLQPGTITILGLKGHEKGVVIRTQRGKLYGERHFTRAVAFGQGATSNLQTSSRKEDRKIRPKAHTPYAFPSPAGAAHWLTQENRWRMTTWYCHMVSLEEAEDGTQRDGSIKRTHSDISDK